MNEYAVVLNAGSSRLKFFVYQRPESEAGQESKTRCKEGDRAYEQVTHGSVRRVQPVARRLCRFFGLVVCGSGGRDSISRFTRFGVMALPYDLSSVNELSFAQVRQEYTACLMPRTPKVGSIRLPVLFRATLPDDPWDYPLACPRPCSQYGA